MVEEAHKKRHSCKGVSPVEEQHPRRKKRSLRTVVQTHIWSDPEDPAPAAMYLMFYINENGEKVYTLKKDSPVGSPTQSAHPARFSPDDKYSKHRTLLKKRFGLLPTQQPPPSY